MKVINLKDGTAHYQGNPGFVAPHAFEDGNREQAQDTMNQVQAQRPGDDDGDYDDEGLDPDKDDQNDPSLLPDEAPAVEPEDDTNRSALGIKRVQMFGKPM